LTLKEEKQVFKNSMFEYFQFRKGVKRRTEGIGDERRNKISEGEERGRNMRGDRR
jgi:hypothetical protein